MKTINILFSVTLCAFLVYLFGCGSPGNKAGYGSASSINIIVFADKIQIAEKVAMYLEDEPGFHITPTKDIQNLDSINLRETDVVILVPMHMPIIPNYIMLSLEDFVDKGGGVIGMSDVVFNGSKLGKIFGEKGYVIPGDARSQKLHIKLNGEYTSPLIKGLPKQFILAGEEPVGVSYEPNAQRLVDMFYETSDGDIKSYCAAWSYRYGDGKTFAFIPGNTEETRYNPFVLRMMANAATWMSKQ